MFAKLLKVTVTYANFDQLLIVDILNLNFFHKFRFALLLFKILLNSSN